MEKIDFKIKIAEQSRYDLVEKIARSLGNSTGKWLKLLSGWDWKDIDSTYRSAISLSKDVSIPFGQAWNWHYNEIMGKKKKLEKSYYN